MKLPQLSLRDLFWLVLVCALAVGWWAERARSRLVELELDTPRRIFLDTARFRDDELRGVTVESHRNGWMIDDEFLSEPRQK